MTRSEFRDLLGYMDAVLRMTDRERLQLQRACLWAAGISWPSVAVLVECGLERHQDAEPGQPGKRPKVQAPRYDFWRKSA